MVENAITNAINNNFSMIFIFTIVIITIRITYLIEKRQKFVLYKEFFMLAFLLYVLLLFYCVTFQDVNYGTNNFIPFKEIFRYEVGSRVWIKNIMGNILLFIPFGLFISFLINNKKIHPIMFVTLVTSVVIEYTQLKIGRTFDIDDITLNLVGGLFGFLIYYIIRITDDHLPDVLRTDLIKNILTILIVLTLIFIYTNFSLWGILR